MREVTCAYSDHVILNLRPSGPGRGRVRDHYRASQVALWTWLLPALEKVGSRFGPDSSFHDTYANSDSFSGPTRPRALLPLTSTRTPTLNEPNTPNSGKMGNNTINSNSPTMSMREVLDGVEAVEVTDKHNYMDDVLHYTTALSLTAALGVSLLLLNILVLAAFHYKRGIPRKSESQEFQRNRGPTTGSSPSHCETLPSSDTLRSLACPPDWPPDYTVSSCVDSEQLSSMHP